MLDAFNLYITGKGCFHIVLPFVGIALDLLNICCLLSNLERLNDVVMASLSFVCVFAAVGCFMSGMYGLSSSSS